MNALAIRPDPHDTPTPTNPPTVIDGPRNNPLCSDTRERCTHHRGWRNCAAFPNGIPDALCNAYRGHREPFPGENGIRFELVKPPAGLIDIPDFLRKKAP